MGLEHISIADIWCLTKPFNYEPRWSLNNPLISGIISWGKRGIRGWALKFSTCWVAQTWKTQTGSHLCPLVGPESPSFGWGWLVVGSERDGNWLVSSCGWFLFFCRLEFWKCFVFFGGIVLMIELKFCGQAPNFFWCFCCCSIFR